MADGKSPKNQNEETPPEDVIKTEDGGRPLDVKSLQKIIADFKERAGNLRRGARLLLLAILGTVLAMTALVVVLPPAINVIEDSILQQFGYQTSQVDFQRETALQATAVRSQSVALKKMINDRNASVEEIENILNKRFSAFEPVYAEPPQPGLFNKISGNFQYGDAEYLYGFSGTSSSDSSSPLLLRRGADDKTWSTPEGFQTGLPGRVMDADTVGETALLIISSEDSSGLFRIDDTGTLSDFFTATDDPEVFMSLAISPDGNLVALASVSIGEAFATIRFFKTDGSLVHTELVESDSRIFTLDIAWQNNFLFVATDTGRSFNGQIIIHRFLFTGEDIGPVFTKPHTGENVLEFAAKRFGELENPVLLVREDRQRNGISKLVLDDALEVHSKSTGDFDGSSNSFSIGPPYSTFVGDIAVWGGASGGYLVLTGSENNTSQPSTSQLSSQRFSPDRMSPFVLGDGLLHISPDYIEPQTDPEAIFPLFFREVREVDMPEAEVDEDLVDFLDGLTPGEGEQPVGGDATAATSGFDAGQLWFEKTLPKVKEPFQSDWLYTVEATDVLDQLDQMSSEWSEIWQARERAATILARLRTADKEGDFWRQVSSITARLAVIALLIYLVNILVNLYRYNMRLAAFYQARGDALATGLALGADVSKDGAYVALADAHTPEQVTFGNKPVSPTETVLKLMQETIKVAKPRD